MNFIDKTKLKSNSDKFWYDDPNILFSYNALLIDSRWNRFWMDLKKLRE